MHASSASRSAPGVSPDAGPLDVLERVIRSERGALARLARREGLGAEEAVDCVHDALCTFLRVTQGGGGPEGEGATRAFLAGIVRNAARNKRRLHRLARPHEALEATPATTPDDSSAEVLLARAEEHIRLRACVDRLCETQKAVVTMRLLEEHGGEDVARLLCISRGYVDVLLHRAKGELLVCMTEEAPPAPPERDGRSDGPTR